MIISDALRMAAATLRDIDEPVREASTILAFAIGKDRAFIVAHPEYVLSAPETAGFTEFVRRRADREPHQYITGHQEFFRLDFEVSPDVLIPRPETEILVESAIELLSDRENADLCEVGVGSGCISVSILHELENVSGIGFDISESALRIASRNAKTHGVKSRLVLRKSDIFDDLEKLEFDLIVSNPPYIVDNDMAGLQPEVRDHEPRLALAGGLDGLAIVRRIMNEAPRFLKPGGWLLIEIGFGQAADVKKLLDPAVWENIEFLPDLQGIPRIIKAQNKTDHTLF